MSEKLKSLNSKSRWLTKTLIAAVILLVMLVTGVFYWYTVSTNEQAFITKIDDSLTHMRDALSIPLWTIDKRSIKQLGDAMLRGDLAVSMVVLDDDGQTVFTASNDSTEETILRSMPIHHKEVVVGELQLRFSLEPLHTQNRIDLTVLAAWGSILLMFVFWIWRLRTEMEWRKQTEMELLRAKQKAETANQAKSIFLANMSHELRTPLSAVLGFSDLMARDPETNQKQSENLSVIKRSGQHLLGLINDVLDMSKIEAGHTELEPEPGDLHYLLDDISNIFSLRAETNNLAFHLERHTDLPQYVTLDVGKLRQVLINLLGNAVKFTGTGSVTLRAYANTLSDHNWRLHFEIEDTGPGIPAKERVTIFDPFAQTGHSPDKHKGTGLGLAISRQFIQLMGGDITMKSTLGEGSLFRFEIPAEASDEAPTSQIEQRVVGLAANEPEWRILIVEDEADNRLLLRRLLESVGFHNRIAVNGEEAIEQFKDWQPHLIWMDMRMPVMDGYEATRRIRELPNSKEVKILALTASAFKEQEEEMLTAGCNAVFYKPYSESDIFNAMAEHLSLQYVYEEDSDLIHQQSLSGLELKDLQNLPDEWLDEFLTAARTGDTKEMLSLTNALDAEYAETKAKLDHCINDFQLQYLIKILEENRGTTDKE